MVATAKLNKYTEIGEDLSFQTSFIQATKALDLAAALANNRQDTETLTTVAALYIQLGERLMQPVLGHMVEGEEEEYELEEETSEKQPIGFAPRPADSIIPEGAENE